MEGSSGRGGVFGKGREGDVLCRSAPLNPSPAYFISEGGRVGRYFDCIQVQARPGNLAG